MAKLPFEEKKRKIIVKREEKTSDKFGCRPEKRATEELLKYGIINIDKPRGPTSHQVSAYAQKILGVDKGGHAGTLDPNVTGCLPIAISRATRVVQALLNAGKEYVAIMHLHKEAEEYNIREACNNFVGRIKQLPPIKSAVKRRERFRQIYYLDILEIKEKDVLFIVGCEAGTYIRKLIHDIGVKMKIGAHMAELRRTKAGPFDKTTLVTLHDLADAFWYYKEKNDDSLLRKAVQPMENAVAHLPKAWAVDTAVDTICHGADLKAPGLAKFNSPIEKDQIVAVMTLKDELIGLGRTNMDDKDMQKFERGVVVKIEKVFMEPGTYPKIEK